MVLVDVSQQTSAKHFVCDVTELRQRPPQQKDGASWRCFSAKSEPQRDWVHFRTPRSESARIGASSIDAGPDGHQIWRGLGQLWATSAEVGLNLPNLGQASTTLGRFRWKLVRCRPTLAGIDHIFGVPLLLFARFGPNFTQIRPSLDVFCCLLPAFGQIWPGVSNIWTTSAQFGLIFAGSGPELNTLRRFRSDLGLILVLVSGGLSTGGPLWGLSMTSAKFDGLGICPEVGAQGSDSDGILCFRRRCLPRSRCSRFRLDPADRVSVGCRLWGPSIAGTKCDRPDLGRTRGAQGADLEHRTISSEPILVAEPMFNVS